MNNGTRIYCKECKERQQVLNNTRLVMADQSEFLVWLYHEMKAKGELTPELEQRFEAIFDEACVEVAV